MAFFNALSELFNNPPRDVSQVRWGDIADVVLAPEGELKALYNRLVNTGGPRMNYDYSSWRYGCEVRELLIKKGWRPPVV